MSRRVEPRVMWGAADGSQGFYTPCTDDVRLESVTPTITGSAPSPVAGYGHRWAKVPSKTASVYTRVAVVLNVRKQFQGDLQDLIFQIQQYIGVTNADAPKDMWYSDDVMGYVLSDDTEAAGSGVIIDYSVPTGWSDDFLETGNYLFFPSGSVALPSEVFVASNVDRVGDQITGTLQNNHVITGLAIFKFKRCYPKARVDSITPTPSATGRAKLTINLTCEGQPLGGDTLPT